MLNSSFCIECDRRKASLNPEPRVTHLDDSACDELPNLIIISQEVPHSRAAGSIVLLRLLRRWPLEKIEVFGPMPPSEAEHLNGRYTSYVPSLARLQFTRLNALAPAIAIISRGAPSIRNVKSNTVVLSVMQSSGYYHAAARFADKHKLPLALIVHDDPEHLERLTPLTRALIRRGNRTVYGKAAERFCISPQMETELRNRYGAAGRVLYPNRSASLRPRDIILSKELRVKGKLTIGYAGSLVYGYRERIEQLLPIFEKANVRLRIYSIHAPSFSSPAMEYAGASERPDDVWERVKVECDAVILPYCGPEHGHQQLYATHFPSKLTEYLALGMPVIVSGPDYATGVQWAKNNPDACALINHYDVSAWPPLLAKLSKCGDFRMNLARGAVSAGEGEFSPDVIEQAFARRMIEIAQGHASL